MLYFQGYYWWPFFTVFLLHWKLAWFVISGLVRSNVCLLFPNCWSRDDSAFCCRQSICFHHLQPISWLDENLRISLGSVPVWHRQHATKGGLWATIFKSADAVHLKLLCYLGDAIRGAVSADLKVVARNRPLHATRSMML